MIKPSPLRQLWMGSHCEKCGPHWMKKLREEIIS